ncbi:bacterioferritin [Bradyrhizobium sp. WD16]|nr:bacterioferritin [Bradyrhizobium sp. WD16]
MSKKTRKKSLATPSPRKAAVKSSRPSARAATKTSKPASAKKSSAKGATRSSTKGRAKAAVTSGRAKPAAKVAAKVAKTSRTTRGAKATRATKKPIDQAAEKPAAGKSILAAPPKPAERPAPAAVEAVRPKPRSAAASPEPSKVPVEAVAAASAEGLVPGGPAPDFDLPRDGGGRACLKDFAGRKLVLFFYPRASTPGCTKEAMDFTRLKADFESSGADAIGISADSIKAQDSFRNKYMLKIPLISDENQEMLKAYGAWGEKSMYGRTFLGIIRTTVLVDAKGRIARIWRHVKVDGHADEVLAAARSL